MHRQSVSPATSHKVEVRVLGQKNASSTGTRMDVDAFTTTN
jgi:aspartokinase